MGPVAFGGAAGKRRQPHATYNNMGIRLEGPMGPFAFDVGVVRIIRDKFDTYPRGGAAGTHRQPHAR